MHAARSGAPLGLCQPARAQPHAGCRACGAPPPGACGAHPPQAPRAALRRGSPARPPPCWRNTRPRARHRAPSTPARATAVSAPPAWRRGAHRHGGEPGGTRRAPQRCRPRPGTCARASRRARSTRAGSCRTSRWPAAGRWARRRPSTRPACASSARRCTRPSPRPTACAAKPGAWLTSGLER